VLVHAQNTSSLAAIGTLLGQVSGFVHTSPSALQNVAGPSLLVHLALVDFHNRGLMALRRKVLSTARMLTINVGPTATVNLCGDLGGGYLLGSGCRLTLTPTRLLRVAGCRRNGPGPPELGTGRV